LKKLFSIAKEHWLASILFILACVVVLVGAFSFDSNAFRQQLAECAKIGGTCDIKGPSNIVSGFHESFVPIQLLAKKLLYLVDKDPQLAQEIGLFQSDFSGHILNAQWSSDEYVGFYSTYYCIFYIFYIGFFYVRESIIRRGGFGSAYLARSSSIKKLIKKILSP
jgi:hypothetical protein